MNTTGPLPRSLTQLIDRGSAGFSVSISTHDGLRVVKLTGELDLAARDRLVFACLAGHRSGVVVDLSQLTFLDCSGYGALVAVSRVLHEHGATLTVRNQTGQPARLLSTLARFEPAGSAVVLDIARERSVGGGRVPECVCCR